MKSAQQQGVAIVLAMGVVAMASMAATAIMITQSTWSRMAELSADHVQAQVLVQAGVDWSRAVLASDRRASNVDHLGEPWALRLPPMPVENGELAGFIEDQQGLFNLNNLVKGGKVNLAQLENFHRLLSTLDLPSPLAETLADWIDADGQPQPRGGAEDDHYLALQSPYLAANAPLTDIAELALVSGFDDGVRARLRPFITALPHFTAVNPNTAAPEVLAAMIEGLDLDDARDLVAQRPRGYFRNYQELVDRLPPGLIVPTENFSMSSDYFLVTMRVKAGGSQARGVALLVRADAGAWPAIVWRKTP